MLFPERRFGLVNNSNNLFDYLFSDPIFNVNTSNRMSTDIKEKDNGYELAMEVPGFDKEDLKLELEKGYLTIMAEHKNSSEKKDEDGHLIRQERYYGSAKRSFYVGDQITKDDIQAKYDKGILNVFIPKKDVKKLENKQTIEIE
ncbi:Hsp20/alpha crystallin family protein [Intestinibacter sp.]|uniref:Hsp20/alpha crystallin family protein n=1 Tax=Intestinibacter sp. TaxID=1965304 RepID=UPI002A9171F0|nr:Hsp20/alpha crystallin family protein [Intestinibacter sp.]MDY5213429.1 Hsp20/alpha crystallin family protein [Intestinibacter sp.]